MRREGEKQFNEDSNNLSRDEIRQKLLNAQNKVAQAQEDLRDAVPANYQDRIRARDVAITELQKWEQNPLAYTEEELNSQFDTAEKDLRHAKNTREYESALRRIDWIRKALQNLNDVK